MWILILSLSLGALAGRLLRRFAFRRHEVVITGAVWLLLFLLGVEVGTNRLLMERLPSLGLEAAALTLGGVVGSGLAARWLTRRTLRKGGRP